MASEFLKKHKWLAVIWGGFNAGVVLGLLDAVVYIFFGLYSSEHFGGVLAAVIVDSLGMGLIGSFIVASTFFITQLGFKLSSKYQSLIAGVILFLFASSLTLYNFGWCFRTPRKPSSEKLKNIVLITIDTLRADALGCYGNSIIQTPTLDRFVQKGWQFVNVVCPVPMTTPSHASILTSTIPVAHGAIENRYKLSKKNRTLTEYLAELGYRTAAFVSAFPLDKKFGLNQGFMLYDDDFTAPGDLRRISWLHVLLKIKNRNRVERNCRWTNSLVIPWLRRYGSEGPFFLWVHYFDAHAPYLPDKIRASYYQNKYVNPFPYRTEKDWLKASYAVGFRRNLIEPGRPEELYWGEVTMIDDEIDRLLKTLSDQGQLNKTDLIFVSDHGESFGEHGRFYTHGEDIYEPALSVPMIFWGNHFPDGKITKKFASLLDISPTLLSELGFKKDPSMQGIDLLDREQKRRMALVENYGLIMSHGASKQRGLRMEKIKLIFEPETGQKYLFDIQNDPLEKDDICDEEKKLCNDLFEITKDSFLLEEKNSKGIIIDTSKETMNKLKSLGYVF